MHDAVGASYTDYARNLPSPPSSPPHSSITITTSTATTSTTVMHAHVSFSVYLMSQYASLYLYIYIYVYRCCFRYHVFSQVGDLFANPKGPLPEDISQHNWFRPSVNVACRVGVYSYNSPCPPAYNVDPVVLCFVLGGDGALLNIVLRGERGSLHEGTHAESPLHTGPQTCREVSSGTCQHCRSTVMRSWLLFYTDMCLESTPTPNGSVWNFKDDPIMCCSRPVVHELVERRV